MADRLEMLRHGREDLEVMLRERVPKAEVWACGRSLVNDRCYSDSGLDLAWRSPTLGPQGLERVEPMAKWPKLTEGQLATMLKRAVHPGEIVKDELEERGVSPASFARQIDVPANRISQILAGKRAVTGDSALRFGHWFGMDPQFWLNLQAQYELALAERLAGAKIRARPTAAGDK